MRKIATRTRTSPTNASERFIESGERVPGPPWVWGEADYKARRGPTQIPRGHQVNPTYAKVYEAAPGLNL